MKADQAIFTSINRRGKAGYQLASRSPGVTDAEAAALTRWCPSHGGLIADDRNRVSVNFHALPGGRYALSRTCEGRPEFSGRGGRQVYTRAVLFDADLLHRSSYRPFLIYRDALALGWLHYDPAPPAAVPRAELSTYFTKRTDQAEAATARSLGLTVFDSVLSQLHAGQPVVLPYAGDRVALAESLLARLEEECVRDLSFTTSLHPSTVRPFRLSVVAPGG